MILYQTWKSKDLPLKLAAYRQKWIDYTQGYEHPLLTDEDLESMVREHFPQYINAYLSFTENIERVDFSRLVMMYIGGVYADLDTYPLQSIEPWVKLNKIVLGREPLEHSRKIYGREVVLCNAFMISPPRNNLWIKLMEYIIENYEPYGDVVENTGPIAMTKFYEKYPEEFEDVVVADPCAFYPMINEKTISPYCDDLSKIFVVHVWENTWTRPWWRSNKIYNRRYWFWGLLSIFTLLWLWLFLERQ